MIKIFRILGFACVVFFTIATGVLISKYPAIIAFLEAIHDEKDATRIAFGAGIEYGAGLVTLLVMNLACLIYLFRKRTAQADH